MPQMGVSVFPYFVFFSCSNIAYLKGRDNSEHLGVDKKIILELILRK